MIKLFKQRKYKEYLKKVIDSCTNRPQLTRFTSFIDKNPLLTISTKLELQLECEKKIGELIDYETYQQRIETLERMNEFMDYEICQYNKL